MEQPTIRPPEEFASGEPGLYRDVPADVYHAFEACSVSRLVKFAKLPAALEWDRKHPKEPTSSMTKGSSAHALLLEPTEFLHKFVTAKQCSATTKAKVQCSKGGQAFQGGKWLCTTHADSELGNDEGRTILSPDEYQATVWMRDGIYRHPAAKKLMGLSAYREVSCLWTDEETGLLCKSRLDTWLHRLGYVVDVKTTFDASPEGFAKKIYNDRLYWQAAFYPAGLHAHGVSTKKWIWLAVENTAPYEAATYEANPTDIDAGWTQLRPLMARYAECVESGKWPGYAPKVIPISMPNWAHSRIQEGLYV